MNETASTRTMMEYDAQKYSAVISYILWFFLGFLGAHRFYLRRVGSGLLQMALHGVGWLTAPIIIGWLFLALWAIWWVIDALLIPGWIREGNTAIARRLAA